MNVLNAFKGEKYYLKKNHEKLHIFLLHEMWGGGRERREGEWKGKGGRGREREMEGESAHTNRYMSMGRHSIFVEVREQHGSQCFSSHMNSED